MKTRINVETVKIGEDVNVTIVPLEGFTTTICLYLTLPHSSLAKATLHLVSLLASSGIARFPSSFYLHRFLDQLYGAILNCSTRRYGPLYTLCCELRLPNKNFFPDGDKLLLQGINTLLDIVLGQLELQSESAYSMIGLDGATVLASIQPQEHERENYVFQKCADILYQSSPFLVSKEKLSRVTEKIKDCSPSELMNGILKDARIDILIAGSTVEHSVFNLLEKKLAYLPRRKPFMLSAQTNTSAQKVFQKVFEYHNEEQAHVGVGSLVNTEIHKHNYCALQIANLVLGGNSHSLLYRELRLSEGLSYLTYSWVDLLSAGSFAYADTNNRNIEKVVDLILGQLECLRLGKFSREDFHFAKDSFTRHILSLYNSGSKLIEHVWQEQLFDQVQPLELLFEHCLKTTFDEVITSASYYSPQIVYCLSNPIERVT